MRHLDPTAFDDAFAAMAAEVRWQEEPGYYPRYRSRYLSVLRRFAQAAPAPPADVLDVGGGQLAFLAQALWGDRATVADVDDGCFGDLRAHGIDAFTWDVARDEPPAGRAFDAILFSEVIEHLPVPGHVALSRLRGVLRPGGVLVCSTPNLHRLRNVAYLLRGRPLFDHFDLPGERGYGHVLEYSAEHLSWQFTRAGFVDHEVLLEDFAHAPNARGDRLLAHIGAPLRRVPRYRDNLLAVGTAPRASG